MPSKAQKMTALTVLTRIKAHDPSFYTANDPMIDAWADVLSTTRRTQAELVAAVDEWFSRPHDRHPRAADIVALAKAAWADAFDREDPDGPLHRELEARADAKAAPDDAALTGWQHTPLPTKGSAEARRKAIEQFTIKPRLAEAARCRRCGDELIGVDIKGQVFLDHRPGSTCELAKGQRGDPAKQALETAQRMAANIERNYRLGDAGSEAQA